MFAQQTLHALISALHSTSVLLHYTQALLPSRQIVLGNKKGSLWEGAVSLLTEGESSTKYCSQQLIRLLIQLCWLVFNFDFFVGKALADNFLNVFHIGERLWIYLVDDASSCDKLVLLDNAQHK